MGLTEKSEGSIGRQNALSLLLHKACIGLKSTDKFTKNAVSILSLGSSWVLYP